MAVVALSLQNSPPSLVFGFFFNIYPGSSYILPQPSSDELNKLIFFHSPKKYSLFPSYYMGEGNRNNLDNSS